MEIIYRAKDGTDFDNEADCAYYERQFEIEMYDERGIRTTSVKRTMIVYLRTTDQTRLFRTLNYEYNIEPEGITDDDTGWFYWDNNHYQWIDPDMIKAFRNLPFDRKEN